MTEKRFTFAEEKQCYNCKYWNCDTGFCYVKMIFTLKTELCEFYEVEE